jgi:hypothetical protein
VDLSPEYLLSLIVAFFVSWQVRTLAGLIVLDLLLGVASALRRGTFDWASLAFFYKSNVVPYIIGYLAFYLVINFLIPPDSLGDLGEVVNQGTVTLAWATLVSTLLKSIGNNAGEMYQGRRHPSSPPQPSRR